MMGKQSQTLKVYDDDLCSKLKNWKDRGELTILDIYDNKYMAAGNISGRLKE